MSQEQKGLEWMEKAERKSKPGMMSMFGGKQQAYEDASEMYVKAAGCFKMAKKWDQAGAAYMKAADMDLKAQSKHDAAGHFVDASNCLKKVEKADAVEALKLAVDLFTDEGRFSIAAKHQKEVAVLYEEDNNFDEAATAYQTAADLYDGEGSTSAANQMLVKVAHYHALAGQYKEAIQIYEDVATKSLQSNLLKFGVKEYFFKAVLCQLALNDLVSAQNCYQRYCDMDISFASSREGKFCESLMRAVEDYDEDAFTDATREYDSITPLDQWKTKLLLKIKKQLKTEEDELA